MTYTLAGLLAVSPELAFWSNMSRMSGLVLLFHVAAFGLMLTSAFKDEKGWGRVFGATAISGALVTLPTYLPSLDPVSETMVKSSFGNDSYVAAYLTFALFFSLILYFQSKNWKQKSIFAASAVIMLFSPLFIDLLALFSFNSLTDVIGTARAAAASILIGLILAAIVYIATSTRALLALSAKMALAIFATILIALSVSILIPGTPIQEKLDDLGLGSRVVFWHSAIEGFKDRPLLGYGPENYSVAFYKHFDPALLTEEYAFETYTSKPHSAYLEILVSGGVLSFVPYMMVWLLAFFSLWRLWQRQQITRPTLALLAGLLSAYLLQNLVLFDTLSSYMGIGIVIAYLAYAEIGPRPYIKLGQPSKQKAVLIGGITMAALYFLVLVPFTQQSRLIYALEEVTVTERASMYEDLFTLSPSLRAPIGEYMMGKLLAVVPPMIGEMTPKQKELVLEDVSSLRGEVERYMPEEPVHYRHAYFLARLYLLEWVLNPEEAILEKVENLEAHLNKLSPNNPQNDWIKAQRQIFASDGEGALSTLQASNAQVPNIQTTIDRMISVEAYLQEETAAPFFTD